MEGTMGPTPLISGLSSAITIVAVDGAVTKDGVDRVAMFTNPKGIYNKYSGKWDELPGQ
ncbi:hypothetical protein PF005_g18558 [Phytophthora fragariae]|uniref:Uncharacterized protein n=2 Tax=Phytophthora fragariae TaxID=53985 RepID=A0A6A3XX09_9STRA|nr:hypothetical protein PF009_g19536 [Phytophthora fragariae]KAE8992633.1 hypothetical protein PF011_g17484 [Phytophthora fragariae]KAE9092539.1 hypothetical protein PF010_g17815 [Phytophthora fragariae]KAE9123096.1 hypothetical protein PF006_g17492 [Phytophthora fragariae]KAE9192189.1 hypothetical protein PF005_g18558 [Phytophthora fragariae]